MFRIRLVPLLVLAMLLEVASLAAGPNFSLSASPSFVDTGAGQIATTMITVTPSGGFTAGVTLSVSGAPAGVTAVFNPGPEAGTRVLWLTVSSTAPQTSTRTLTVTGTGGGVTHTAGIDLTVAGFVSDFVIFANPASLTVAPGSSGPSTIFATPLTRFTGLPTFSASRLPAGVTASFGPTTASASGSRVALTLTAASTVHAGTAAVTVTGRVGFVTTTTRISLTVS
jgi:hypothetical protein